MARILIVDDSPSQLMGIRRIVEKLGHEALTAEDGAAGVEAAKRELPDLILMDVQLPKISGLDATRTLKSDPRTRDIPIIVITSFALSGDREKAAAAGATRYLAKPYSPRELLAMVREILPET